MRSKTKHRLSILAVATVGIVGAAGGAIAWRERQIRHQLNVERATGLDAYRNRDWEVTIAQLEPYTSQRPQDSEAVFALAIAHIKKPSPDHEDVADAIAYLRRYHELVPGNADAQHRLMNLLRQTRQWEEATDLAEQILSVDPNDSDALGALAVGMEVSGRSQEALTAAEHYNEINPTDLDGHNLTFQIMRALKMPASALLDRAADFQRRFPGDPRLKLAEVMAYTVGKGTGYPSADAHAEEAKELGILLAASAATPPDGQFVRHAVELLDGIHRYAEAQDLLSRAAGTLGNDPYVRLTYAQRLWETGQDQQVVDFLADEAVADGDTTLLGFKALALRDLKKNAECDAIIAALAGRTDDPQAIAWAAGLPAENEPSLRKRLDDLRTATIADPANGVMHFLFAQAWRQAGEEDLALEQARQTASGQEAGNPAEMGSWTAPHLMLAQILSARGNLEEAATEADDAIAAAQAAPAAVKASNEQLGLAPAVAKAVILFDYAVGRNDQTVMTDLLAQLDDLRQAHPRDPQTAAIYVRLLARTGQADKARQVIAGEIAAPVIENGQTTLLDLADASGDEHLGMEPQLLDAAQAKYGLTPRLAFDRARAMVYTSQKTAAEALAFLKAADVKGEAWEKDLYTARFLEDAKDSGAGAGWVGLGNAYPDNLTVQNAILDPSVALSAWSGQQAFIGTTIDRVRGLLGDEALGWKLAKARWLLAGSTDQSAANDASVLLSEVLKHESAAGRFAPHVLQASAMERLGNVDGAAGEMSQAWLLAPGDATIGFDLMRLYHAAGRFADSADIFDRLTTLQLTTEMAVNSAQLMFDQHDLTRAAALLQRYDDPNHPSSALIGTLGMIDQRAGRVKEAGDLFLRIQDATDVPPIVISSAADFFASIGDSDKANKFLAKLSGSNLPAVDQKLKLAAYQERYGRDQAAVNQLYLDAIAASNGQATATVGYVGYLIRQSRLAEAQEVADGGLKQWNGSAELTTLKSLAAALAGDDKQVAGELVPVVAALTVEPGNPATAELIAAIGDRQNGDERIAGLVRQYPNFYPPYEVTVRRRMSRGNADTRSKGAELAEQAMDRFADLAPAARLACVADSELGHWSLALAAGEQWRQRSFQDPVDADWHIALCLINLNRAGEAINRLGTYIIDAKSSPDDPVNRQILRTYAAALIGGGRVQDAADLLGPMTAKSAEWRAIWLDLGRQAFSDSDGAAAWIKQVIPLIPPGSQTETELLARTWFDLATLHGYASGFANCRDLLSPLADAGKLDPHTLLTLAMAEDQGHFRSAAADYRRVISVGQTSGTTQPADMQAVAAAANNLANLLMSQNDPAALTEAQNLAGLAVADSQGDPAAPYYHDTLGRIDLLESKFDAAAGEFQTADGLTPGNPAILIGWADALARGNKMQDAVVKLQAAEAHISSDTQLPANIQQELDSVQKSIGKGLAN